MSAAVSIYKFLWRQSWLSLKLKKDLYKRLVASGETPDAPFSKDFFGLKYQGNLSNNIEYYIFYFGAFEKPQLFFLRDTLLNLEQDKSVFCDVGANIGQHSLFMAQYAASVHSFEPYEVVARRLRSHIELNQLSNITIHPVGLSDNKAQMDFYAPTGRNQGIGSFDAATVDKGNKIAGKLDLVRGDDYLAQQEIQGITLLKVDVEGFEKFALHGLAATLRRDRPILVCEVSYGGDLSFQDLDDFRGALPEDYSLFTLDIRKPDGSKARIRGAKAKRSGKYTLIEFEVWRENGQDDIIACPQEKLEILPRHNRSSA